METKQLLDQIEAAPSSASSLLRKHRGLPGLSRDYCARVVEHFGSDTGKAIQLGSAWKPVFTYGDEPALALRAKAIFERLNGRWSKSAKSFIEAGEAATDPVERASFQVGAIDSLARGGNVEGALALGRSLASRLDDLGEHGLAARVRLNLGNALFWQDRMEEARGYLGAAAPVLASHGYAVEAASARMGLSTTHLYGGRLREASRHANEALSEARQLGLDYLAALCEINLSQIELLSGRADRALDLLLDLRGRLAEAPVDLARTLEFLGDAYFRLNLWPEAVDAYHEALSDRTSLIALHRAHLHLGLGQALRSAGRPIEAIQELRTARARYARLKNHAWGAAAMTAHAQALLDMGRVREARALAHRAVETGSSFHLAEALLTACEIDADRQLLGRADRLIRREGYWGLLWKVHYLQARAASPGRRLGNYRRMFDAIQGGRMQVTSISSRASYMRDKTRAVQDYLGELLSRGALDATAEAIGVIEQTRSITLLDELLSARASSLDGAALERLGALREELRELGGEDVSSGAARRLFGIKSAVAAPRTISSVQRRWIDLNRDLRAEVSRVTPPAPRDTVLFAQTQGKLFAISDGVPHRLPMTVRKLEDSLKWLQFELLAPMADREADSADALQVLRELANGLIQPWIDGSTAICPDGVLWRVPWSACLALVDPSLEAELRLHPSLGGNTGDRLPKNPRVALWSSNAPDLPHAGTEAKRFLERFPDAEVFTSAQSIRDGMKGDYDLVHVVAHAKHRASNPMFSAVSFSDGPLFATEIARACIRPGLVTLSACETGTMSVVSRDEPDGLARGFLARGAKNVVASMWPLDDEAADRMFDTFFTYLSAGGSVADSLTQTRQAARRWRAHPYFWGSLALYGGYANT